MKKILGILLVILFTGCTNSRSFTTIRESVFKVVIENDSNIGYGSAVLISCEPEGDKYILKFLSCKHVTSALPVTTSRTIEQYSNTDIPIVSYPIIDVKNHESLDIVIITAYSTKYIKPVDISSQNPFVAQNIKAIGFPLGIGLVTTEGLISFKLQKENTWVCTAQIFPGNSGGGVFDSESNNLIGITSQVYSIPNTTILVCHMHEFIPVASFINWLLAEVSHEGKK